MDGLEGSAGIAYTHAYTYVCTHAYAGDGARYESVVIALHFDTHTSSILHLYVYSYVYVYVHFNPRSPKTIMSCRNHKVGILQWFYSGFTVVLHQLEIANHHDRSL